MERLSQKSHVSNDQKYFSRTAGPQVTSDLKGFPFLKISTEDTGHLTFCLTFTPLSCFCRKCSPSTTKMFLGATDQKNLSRTGGPQVTLDLEDFPFLKILAEDVAHLLNLFIFLFPSPPRYNRPNQWINLFHNLRILAGPNLAFSTNFRGPLSDHLVESRLLTCKAIGCLKGRYDLVAWDTE